MYIPVCFGCTFVSLCFVPVADDVIRSVNEGAIIHLTCALMSNESPPGKRMSEGRVRPHALLLLFCVYFESRSISSRNSVRERLIFFS